MAIKKLKGNSQWDKNNYEVAFECLECKLSLAAKVEFRAGYTKAHYCIPTFCHLEVKQKQITGN